MPSLATPPFAQSDLLPPQAPDAEMSVLGALLLDNSAFDRIGDVLQPEDFYRDEHRRIFRAIVRLLEHGQPADIVTVSEAMAAAGEGERAGGLGYLGELAANTPSSANIRRYAELVRDKAILRALLAATGEISQSALAPQGQSAEQILDAAESRVFAIAETGRGATDGLRALTPILADVIGEIQELYERQDDSEITGTPTGFHDLDRLTSGLQPGDLIIIAGRPSMGKTAFALNIAEHVGIARGLPVAVFSMEMGAGQLAARMLASLGRLDSRKLRTGRLSDDEWTRLSAALGQMHEKPLFIDETGGMTPTQIRARARRLARQFDGQLGLIVVDYLQLMTVGRNSDNRTAELAEISRSLKALAKELHVPLIALSQLSRKVEERADKRPMMSDLRESGAIEQDADVIMMMFREEYYSKDPKDQGRAEVIIGKQRNGPTDTVMLAYLAEFTRFENLARS